MNLEDTLALIGYYEERKRIGIRGRIRSARATVTVRALDGDTGKPIEGVVVNIKKASAKTNKSGRARLSVEASDTHEEDQK